MMKHYFVLIVFVFVCIQSKAQIEHTWKNCLEKAIQLDDNKDFHKAEEFYHRAQDSLLIIWGLNEQTKPDYTYILYRRAHNLFILSLITGEESKKDSACAYFEQAYNLSKTLSGNSLCYIGIECVIMIAEIYMSDANYISALNLMEGEKEYLLSLDDKVFNDALRYYFYKTLTRLYNQFSINLIPGKESQFYFLNSPYSIIKDGQFYKEYISAYEELVRLTFIVNKNNIPILSRDLQLLAEHYRFPDDLFKSTKTYERAFGLWEGAVHNNDYYFKLCCSYLSSCNNNRLSLQISKDRIVNELDSIFLNNDTVGIIDVIKYLSARLEDVNSTHVEKEKYLTQSSLYFEGIDIEHILYYICKYGLTNIKSAEIDNLKIVINHLSIVSKCYFLQKNNEEGDLYLNKAIQLSLLLPDGDRILLKNLIDAIAISSLSIGDIEKYSEYKSVLITSKIAQGEIPSLKDILLVANQGNATERIDKLKQQIEVYQHNSYDKSLIEFYLCLGEALVEVKDLKKADSVLKIVDSLLFLSDQGDMYYSYTKEDYMLIKEKYRIVYANYLYMLGRYAESKYLLEKIEHRIDNHLAVDILTKIAYELKDTNQLIMLLKKDYELLRDYIIEEFCFLGSSERDAFINSPTFQWMLNVPKYAEGLDNPGLNELVYDYILLTKGCNLQTTIFFNNYSDKITNNYWREKYNNYLNTKNTNSRDTSSRIYDNNQYYVHSQEKEILRISGLDEYQLDSLFFTHKDILRVLKPNEASIEFVTYSKDNDTNLIYAAIVIKSNSLPTFIKLCTQKDIDTLLLYSSKVFEKEYINKAFSVIWEPIMKELCDVDIVWFSPCGGISFINIELLLPDTIYGHRLSTTRRILDINDFPDFSNIVMFGGINYDTSICKNVSYAANNIASTIIRGSKLDDLRKGLCYLPHSLSEVTGIQNLFSDNNIVSQIHSGPYASEEVFKDLSGGGTSILHIATHGFYLNKNAATDNPIIGNRIMRRSGLIFSGAQKNWKQYVSNDIGEDGILLSEEIENLNLSSVDLLVLSSCETGLGYNSTDGVLGLQRAFKIAGVKTLIMSLWNVSDEVTNYMMITFYKELIKTNSKYRAFKRAINITKQAYDDPRYWASFVMLD